MTVLFIAVALNARVSDKVFNAVEKLFSNGFNGLPIEDHDLDEVMSHYGEDLD